MNQKNHSADNIPELRFPEFEKDREWGEKFVEDFFLVGSSKRVLQEDWTNQGIPFYRTRELVSLSKNEPFGNEIFISEELFLEISEKYGLPSEGDFLVSGVGTLGICYQVQADNKFYFKDGNVLWFKLERGLNSTYFKYCFQSDHIQNQILAQASISTVGTYTIQNAKKTTFWYPPTTYEQQKIASFLSSIDEFISAQSQKLEALKVHKKGLMQQLFPAEGETVPKLRFAEFRDDGEWEKLPIGEKVDLFSGYPFKSSEISVETTGIPLMRGINITEGFIRHSQDIDRFFLGNTKKLEKYRLRTNDLVIGMDGSKVGKNSALIAEEDSDSLLIQRVARLRSKNEGTIQFIFQQINSVKFHSYVGRINTSGGIPHISADQINEFEICFPNFKEQQKIASCLSSLDELITAQSQKLDALKVHKKGLMQQLFPITEVQ